jgi:aryl-alcohol dehydrogenase-like predicted oxidoreductase
VRTRKLGYTDLHLTTVGFGAASVAGGRDYGNAHRDEAESLATVHRALDLGINWIDVAPAYGHGHGEELVGRVVAERSERVMVATKCGQRWDEDGRPHFTLKAESLREEAELSLRRLSVEVIDLYQIHRPRPEEELEEGWGTIVDLIREGKIRYGGVSNVNLEQLKRVQAIHPVASVQPRYSMLERDIEKELLAYCVENNIGVIPYSPMQSGLLTGKFTRAVVDALPQKDWRRGSRQFKEPAFTANLDFVEKLRPLVTRLGRLMGQLAIAWALRRPDITAVIVGARRPSQIEESAPAGDWVLPDDVLAEIEQLLAENEEAKKR